MYILYINKIEILHNVGTSVEYDSAYEKNQIKIGVFGLGVELKGLVNSNAYKETKYLDFPSFWIKFDLKQKPKKISLAYSKMKSQENYELDIDLTECSRFLVHLHW